MCLAYSFQALPQCTEKHSYSVLQTPQDKDAVLRHIRMAEHTSCLPCLPIYPKAFFPVQPQNVWKARLKRKRSSLLSTNLFNASCTWVVIALLLRKDHCSCLAKAVALPSQPFIPVCRTPSSRLPPNALSLALKA